MRRPRGLLTVGGRGGLLPISVATVLVGAAVGTFLAVQPSSARVPAGSSAATRSLAALPGAAPSPDSGTSRGAVAAASGTSLAAVNSPFAAAPLVKPTPTVGKKGVAVWSFDGVDAALAASGAHWYYTWSTVHPGIDAPSGVEFVPMIWGPHSVNPEELAQAEAAGPYLLGFNEPDLQGQANMTVDQALSLWPQLMDYGQILGSPAVSAGADRPGGWLDQFMSGVQARGYRVDFITLHWYGTQFDTPDAVSELKTYVQSVYERYHKPVWLTEYALTDYSHGNPRYPTDQQQAAFVTASTQMLASLPYVQRYAWFALPNTGPGSNGDSNTGLFNDGTDPTIVGKAFETAPGD